MLYYPNDFLNEELKKPWKPAERVEDLVLRKPRKFEEMKIEPSINKLKSDKPLLEFHGVYGNWFFLLNPNFTISSQLDLNKLEKSIEKLIIEEYEAFLNRGTWIVDQDDLQ